MLDFPYSTTLGTTWIWNFFALSKVILYCASTMKGTGTGRTHCDVHDMESEYRLRRFAEFTKITFSSTTLASYRDMIQTLIEVISKNRKQPAVIHSN